MPPLENLASLRFALPEVVLSCGAMALLVLGLLRPRASRALAAAGAVLVAAVAVVVTAVTADPAPRGLFGGLLARDPFADFFKWLAPVAAALVALLSLRSRDAIDEGDPEGPEFQALLITAALGVQLMAAASDLLVAYLGLELVSIMGYVLTGMTAGSRRSAEASLKYVVYGGVASGAFLYGLSLLYGFAGGTSFAALRGAAMAAPAPLAVAALVLCLAGFGYKVAIVPFHMWCPDVYEGAPTPVAAFLSVAPKAGGFALVMRFFAALPAHAAGGGFPWALLALVIAIVTMTVGNLTALGQRSVKRLLAYSSIAHAGYLFLGVAVGGVAGYQASLVYLGVYLFMNLAAFGAVIAFRDAGGGDTLESWAGLGPRVPLAGFTLTVALFALAGLPPTAGFVGKYYLFSAAIAEGRATGEPMYTVAALVAVLNTVASVYYYARVVRVLYLERAPGAVTRVPLASPLPVVLVLLVVPVIALGLFWGPLDALATRSLVMWVPAAVPIP